MFKLTTPPLKPHTSKQVYKRAASQTASSDPTKGSTSATIQVLLAVLMVQRTGEHAPPTSADSISESVSPVNGPTTAGGHPQMTKEDHYDILPQGMLVEVKLDEVTE